jgi:hypothetical protein
MMLGSVALSLLVLQLGGTPFGAKIGHVKALNDGVARLPVMGYNSTSL